MRPETIHTLGSLHILVNNAAFQQHQLDIESISKPLAHNLVNKQIRVNCVPPGRCGRL